MGNRRTRAVVVVVCVSSLSLLSAQSAALAARHGTPPPSLGRSQTGPATPGAELWLKRYNGPANSVDEATALGVSPDGSKVFVTGYSDGSGSFADYATVAYGTATGTQLWAKRYGPGHGYDAANAIGVSPDGSKVFV